jgi:hypothetical protein
LKITDVVDSYFGMRKVSIENDRFQLNNRDYNHPCIVAWTPLNESCGVQEISTDTHQQAWTPR